METTIAPQPPKPVEQIGIFVRLWRFLFGGAGAAPQPAPRRLRSASPAGRRTKVGAIVTKVVMAGTAIATGTGVSNRDRDRDRGRHEHKDKSCVGRRTA